MKTDGPRPHIVKYGMTAEYVDCLVKRHFGVLFEEQVIYAARMDHAVRVAPALNAALDFPPPSSAPAVPAPMHTAPEVASQQLDWRARLGIG